MTVPAELKAIPHWVNWRMEMRKGKLTKPPYRTDGQGLASVDDSLTWGPFNDAYKLWKADPTYGGVGFVLTAGDPFCGVDLDKCRDPATGVVEDWAMDIVLRLNSYTEITPSNTGLRVWIKATLTGTRRRKDHVEIYDRERYFTLTSVHLEGTPETIEDRQKELDDLYAELFPPTLEVVPNPSTSLGVFDVLDKLRAASNSAKFDQLMHGDTGAYGSDSEADLALVSLIAFYTQNESDILAIVRMSKLWDDKWERPDYQRRTLDKVLSTLTETWSPPETGGKIRKGQPARPPASPTEVYSLADLEHQTMVEPRAIVPGVLHVGLNMLVGKGKLGKSWLALDIALAVAGGTMALSAYKVAMGEVLYLALEDTKRRMKNRVELLEATFPPALFVAHRWPKLDEGGIDAMRAWLTEHPKASLLIIDVWKGLRNKRVKGASLYDEDYEHLVPLQLMAHEFDIAILVVHHTRKASAEDVTDEISGSGGVLAALDTCIVLHRSRTAADGEIWVTGRDLEDLHLALNFESGRWTVLGQAHEISASKEREEVLRVLRALIEPVTILKIGQSLGWNTNRTRHLVFKMVTSGEIRRVSNTTYTYPVTPVTVVTGVTVRTSVTAGVRASGSGVTGVTGYIAPARAELRPPHALAHEKGCLTCGGPMSHPIPGGKSRCLRGCP